jgi:hypothetical protein
VVLIRVLLGVALLAGCKQSLFSSGGDDTTVDSGTGDGGGDGSIPSSCPATCLADAAADFGMTKWRYLDDNRNRTWTPMTAAGNVYDGSGDNRISSCANESSAPACSPLPGALLVNTTAAGSPEPALSYTSTASQVIQLTVRVHVPTGAPDHEVRVYRNSREDVLYTADAAAGTTFERAITLDALANDRFYVGLAAVNGGAEQIGVHVYINKTEDTFPKSCQVALSFDSTASGSVTINSCGSQFVYWDEPLAEGVTPMLTAGPIADLQTGADIPADRYYEGGSVLARDGDTTTQLWVRHDAFISTYSGWVFSDEDLSDADGGGLGIYIYDQAAPKIGIVSCTNGTTNPIQFQFAEAPLPSSTAWHFVRVVHTGGMVHLCVDGARVASYPLPAGRMQSTYRPHIGKNVVWTPSGAYFDGAVDDVRVLTGALPCDLVDP